MSWRTTLKTFLKKVIDKHLNEKPAIGGFTTPKEYTVGADIPAYEIKKGYTPKFTGVMDMQKYIDVKTEFIELEDWNDLQIVSQEELVDKMLYIKKLSEKHGWTKIKGNKQPLMISFLKEDTRMNIYPTTMTVSTALEHPTSGKTQLFRKEVSLQTLNSLFINPRTHTNKGYYKKW